MEAEELVMPATGTYHHPAPVIPVDRAPGGNDVGVVAWLLTLKTPECPQGRQVGDTTGPCTIEKNRCRQNIPSTCMDIPTDDFSTHSRSRKTEGRSDQPSDQLFYASQAELHSTPSPGEIWAAPSVKLLCTTAQVVAVANDITFNSGAFGPREDAVFRAVTEYALEERLPLLYLAANSGARVGLANEIKKCLQVHRRYLVPFHSPTISSPSHTSLASSPVWCSSIS